MSFVKFLYLKEILENFSKIDWKYPPKNLHIGLKFVLFQNVQHFQIFLWLRLERNGVAARAEDRKT